jgi:hypothetical protein
MPDLLVASVLAQTEGYVLAVKNNAEVISNDCEL